MQIDSTLEIVWERWDDPGANDGGGARVSSYHYPAEVDGALVLCGEADEEIPAWHTLLALLAEHAPVTDVATVSATIVHPRTGAWTITLRIDDFCGDAKPGYAEAAYEDPGEECGGSEYERLLD